MQKGVLQNIGNRRKSPGDKKRYWGKAYGVIGKSFPRTRGLLAINMHDVLKWRRLCCSLNPPKCNSNTRMLQLLCFARSGQETETMHSRSFAATRAPLQVSSQSRSYLKQETLHPRCGFSWSLSTRHTSVRLDRTCENSRHAVTLVSIRHRLANIARWCHVQHGNLKPWGSTLNSQSIKHDTIYVICFDLWLFSA